MKTLPGTREALEQRSWIEADKQAAVIARVLEELAAVVERATAVLK